MSGLFKRKAPAQTGPDTSSAIYQQQQAENQKSLARERVNRTFGYGDQPTMQARRKMYTDASGAARDLNLKYLGEDRKDATDSLTLQMARQGLSGGSTDIEGNAKIGRAYNQGVVDIGNQTDQMVRALEGQDEEARLQLLDSISQGMDAETAVNLAGTRLKTGLDNSIAQSRGRLIGNVFQNLTPVGANMAYSSGSNSAAGSVPMPSGYSGPMARPRNRTVSW